MPTFLNSVKQKLRISFQKVTGFTIYKKLPFGVDPFDDISFYLPHFKFENYFDVGANYGQSAIEVLNKFPETSITCFEPSSSNYKILEQRLKKNKNVKTVQCGLSSSEGKVLMEVQEKERYSTMNRISSHSQSMDENMEEIETTMLDTYCLQHGYDRIGYLKIDVEGHELEVLKGATTMLSASKIDFLQVEVGMNCENDYHVPLEKIKDYLESVKYLPFGIYDQILEWKQNRPKLRVSNIVFISKKLADSTKIKVF